MSYLLRSLQSQGTLTAKPLEMKPNLGQPCQRMQGCSRPHVGQTYLPFADEYAVKPWNGQEVNDETVRMMVAALFYWLEDSQLESDEIWAEKKVESKFFTFLFRFSCESESSD